MPVEGVRRPAWAEISRSAIAHNVATLATMLGETKLCAVVKANGYGHGAPLAAKEAVMKSLGVGLGLPFHAIEVRKHASGAPDVALHAEAAELAASRGVTAFHLSLTHTDQTAIAMVIATDEAPRAG